MSDLFHRMVERAQQNAASNPDHPVNRWEDMAGHVLRLLEDIRAGVNAGDHGTQETRTMRPFVIQTDAGGNGQEYLRLPAGSAWDLQTFAFQMNVQGSPGYIAFYKGQEEIGTSLLKVAPATQVVDDNFGPGVYVSGQNSLILVVARALTPASIVAGNLSAKAFSERPHVHTDASAS